MDGKRARTLKLVLSACRRLQGVRELTPTALSEETGFGLDTCRSCRGELLKAGLIEKTWRDRRKGERVAGIGVSPEEHAAIQDRIARVRAAKAQHGEYPLDHRTLAQILPS